MDFKKIWSEKLKKWKSDNQKRSVLYVWMDFVKVNILGNYHVSIFFITIASNHGSNKILIVLTADLI